MNGKIDEEIDWQKELYGGGYLQLDRERDRRRKVDFWAALDGMSSGVALMVDWEFIFGSAVDVVLPFLEVTGERSETFPCPGVSPCGCRHGIRESVVGYTVYGVRYGLLVTAYTLPIASNPQTTVSSLPQTSHLRPQTAKRVALCYPSSSRKATLPSNVSIVSMSTR